MHYEASYNIINCCDHTTKINVSQAYKFWGAMGTKSTKHFSELVGTNWEKGTKMGTNFEVHMVWILTRHIAHISRNEVHTFWGILHVYHWDKLYLEIINRISMHSVHNFRGILHIYRWDNLYLEIINLMYLSF